MKFQVFITILIVCLTAIGVLSFSIILAIMNQEYRAAAICAALCLACGCLAAGLMIGLIVDVQQDIFIEPDQEGQED